MILYLHGLNSAGSSYKASVMRERLAPIRVMSPTYPAQFADQAIATLGQVLETALSAQTSQTSPLILVGSSMGGFYGRYLASLYPVDHLVMINPALQPWTQLDQVVGWQTNEALGERYYLSPEMVLATRKYAIDEDAARMPVTLLLDKGDELIDWRVAASLVGEAADVHAFDGGDHAFQHMDEAIEILAELHQTPIR